MSFLDRFRRTERKASSVASLIYQSMLGRPAFPQRDALMLAREGYRQNVIASACIQLVAQSVASLEWDLYAKSTKGDDTEIEAHPVLDLLARPNAQDDGESLIRKVATYYGVSGNAYVEQVPKAANGAGEPYEIFALRTDRVKVIPGADGYPESYSYTVNGAVRTLPRELVLHLAEPNPTDDWYGMSRLDPAGFAIDTHTGSGALMKALLDNSARPSGAFVYKGEGNLSQDQREGLRQQVAEMYQGTKNGGRPLLLDGSIEWQTIGFNLNEMQFIDGKNQSAREIALACGVPPLLLGIPGDNTFSNFEEANRAFWRHTVLPLANRLCRSFGRFLLPAYADGANLYFSYDADEIPALASERAAKWTAIQNADFLTVNEKREALGYEAIDGGEVLLVPATMVPIGDAGLMPEGGAGASNADDELDDEPKPTTEKAADHPPPQPQTINITIPDRSVIVHTGEMVKPHQKRVTITERDEKGRPIAGMITPVMGEVKAPTVERFSIPLEHLNTKKEASNG